MNRLRSGGSVLLRLLCVSAILLILQACIPPALLGPPPPPFTQGEIHTILNHIIAQGNLVTTLFCTGTLTVEQGELIREANISIVGKRSPFQIKMEITHPWGSPIADLLVDDSRFTLVFFPKKQVVLGSVNNGKPHRFLPVPLDPSAIWGFVRGYPLLPRYGKAVSPGKGVIRLLDMGSSLRRRLDVDLSLMRPRACYFPAINMTQFFKSFEKDGTIEFARKVVLKEDAKKNTLAIQIKNVLFNPHLPRGVFQVARPAGFKIIDLSPGASAP